MLFLMDLDALETSYNTISDQTSFGRSFDIYVHYQQTKKQTRFTRYLFLVLNESG